MCNSCKNNQRENWRGKKEKIDLDNSRSFYSQSFVDVILVGERKGNKNSF